MRDRIKDLQPTQGASRADVQPTKQATSFDKLSKRQLVELLNGHITAAENILRRGISELWSGSKTVSDTASRACTQESHAL